MEPLFIRTYNESESESESGLGSASEPEIQRNLVSDDEDDTNEPIENRLQHNIEYMDDQITNGNPPWSLQTRDTTTPDGTAIILINKPTASQMQYRLLNPYIYMNIQSINNLNHLAD